MFSILSWMIVLLAALLGMVALRYVMKNKATRKRSLRVHSVIGSIYIATLFSLMLSDIVPVVETSGAFLARIGFVVLLGIQISEILSDG